VDITFLQWIIAFAITLPHSSESESSYLSSTLSEIQADIACRENEIQAGIALGTL
jgi:hypothetical protein